MGANVVPQSENSWEARLDITIKERRAYIVLTAPIGWIWDFTTVHIVWNLFTT